jgi:hypothetical protein
MDSRFDWVPFYEEFAQILFDSINEKREIAEKFQQVLDIAKPNYDLLTRDEPFKSIDPFTIFALFNHDSHIHPNGEIKRIQILEAIKEVFEVESDLPEYFDGIPGLRDSQTVYYNSDAEKKQDISKLWKLFELAMNYVEDPSDETNLRKAEKAFNKAIHVHNIANAKLTMALFWMQPRTFLSLDGRNIKYIKESPEFPDGLKNLLPSSKITGADYFELTRMFNTFLVNQPKGPSSINQLSLNAYLWDTEKDATKAEDFCKLSKKADFTTVNSINTNKSKLRQAVATILKVAPELIEKPDLITEVTREYVQRVGQSELRAKVVKERKVCEVTSFKLEKALVASHIKPWRVCNDNERLDPDNILLLSPNLDTLFDKGFISFDDQGKILIGNELKKEEANPESIGIDDSLHIERPFSEATKEYLKYHRENIFNKNSDTK